MIKYWNSPNSRQKRRVSHFLGFRVSPRPSCASADSRSSRDAGVGSLEKPSRSDEVQTLVVVSSLPQPALVPRARSQHDGRRPPRQVPSAGGRRRETRGARLFRDPAHLLAPRHRRVPPVPGVAHRGAHRAVRPVARATTRAERGRARHPPGALFVRRLSFFLPCRTSAVLTSHLSRAPSFASLDTRTDYPP